MTRAKFCCGAIEDYGQSKKVKLFAVYEPPLGDNAENKGFTRATPWGEISMTVDNPAAAVEFRQGAYYYVDFHEAS